MPDREKVLKALEYHKETAVCNGCPYAEYSNTPEGYCPVYDDAIALLREQEAVEPRVLTLEEVMKLRHGDEIWIEYGGAHSKLFMLTVARRRRWGFTFYRHFPCYWDNYGGKNNTNHDWWWRCWSNRPTAQQREAVKWDG